MRRHLHRCCAAQTAPLSLFHLSCGTGRAGSQLPSHHCNPSALQEAKTHTHGGKTQCWICCPQRSCSEAKSEISSTPESLWAPPTPPIPLWLDTRAASRCDCFSGDLLSKHLDIAGHFRSTEANNLLLHFSPALAGLCSIPRYCFTPLQGLGMADAELCAGPLGLPGTARGQSPSCLQTHTLNQRKLLRGSTNFLC